jgi:lysozyme
MSRRIDPRAENLIKDSETLVLKAYRCPAGVLTIGFGHTGPDVVEGEEIDRATAEALFRRDAARFEAFVDKTCPSANEGQFGAMVSLSFNIGEAAFASSSVARLHNGGRYAEAAQAFALWNKSKGKVLGGLVARRAREAALYLADGAPQDTSAVVDGEKPLHRSRAITGQTVAGGATAAGIVADQVREHAGTLPSIQDAIYTLLPYFDALKWALLAVVLAGLAYAVYARVQDRHEGRC